MEMRLEKGDKGYFLEDLPENLSRNVGNVRGDSLRTTKGK
jgi:hypothetical protein